MEGLIYKAVIPIEPKTKKNSQEIHYRKSISKGAVFSLNKGVLKLLGVPFISQSKAYKQYEKDAGWFLRPPVCGCIDFPVNVKCLFYRKDHNRVDLTNLEEAIDDILVKYRVLKDDCFKILQSHDGSQVLVDPDNPRTEIYITRL